MRYVDLVSNSAWIYRLNSLDEFKRIEGLKELKRTRNQVTTYCISKIVEEESNNEKEIINQIKNKNLNIDEISKLIDVLRSNSIKEEYCQVLLYENVNILFVICNDIRKWKTFNSNSNYKKISIVNKNLFRSMEVLKFINNILSISVKYFGDSNMVSGCNIHGNGLQSSKEYHDIIEDNDAEITKCIFQPLEKEFLVTLRSENKIEVSKYAKNEEYIEFLNEFCNLISNNYLDEDRFGVWKKNIR